MRLELPSTSADVQYFLTDDTWTKASAAKSVSVICIGPGGGGGSGRRGAGGTYRGGGGGGAGGGMAQASFPADTLPDTVTITVPPASLGGASVTTNDTSGTPGTGNFEISVATSFGAFLRAAVGGAGGGGEPDPTTFTTPSGTFPLVSRGTSPASMFKGADGGDGSGRRAATTAAGGAGGGGGGGDITDTNVDHGGGNASANLAVGTTRGLGGAWTVPAQVATSPDDALVGVAGGGGGGGGAGSDVNTPGQDGANGAAYGGGGGGGGAAWNGQPSGKGGDGGPGICMVITYF